MPKLSRAFTPSLHGIRCRPGQRANDDHRVAAFELLGDVLSRVPAIAILALIACAAPLTFAQQGSLSHKKVLALYWYARESPTNELYERGLRRALAVPQGGPEYYSEYLEIDRFPEQELETYFTAGVKEVRAWTITKGMKAPQAAGVIHTDFEKGFIKAEVIAYKDFTTLGSESACREVGKLRIEGKEYIVQDGDVMHFRFNV